MLKKLMVYVSILAILTSSLVFSASAEEHKVLWTEENREHIRATDGWEYNIYYKWEEFEVISDEIEFISVVGYKGKKSDITVPTEYNGFKIDTIEPFDCSDSVKTIRITKGIASIQGDYYETGINPPEPRFNAVNLKEIIVSKANKKYKSVSGVLYTKDGKGLITYPDAKKGKSFTVPSKVEQIWESAFHNVKYLENLTISENVETLGEGIYNTSLKRVYYKNIKLKKSDFNYGEYAIGGTRVGTIYVFKNSGAYDYYSEMNSENVAYKRLKFLSKPTKPERTEIKKIRRTSKGIKITLKDVKCSYQKVYRYSSKTKKYEYIGTTKTKTFYDTTAKPNKTYKYKARACNKKNFIKANGRYSKVATIKK